MKKNQNDELKVDISLYALMEPTDAFLMFAEP